MYTPEHEVAVMTHDELGYLVLGLGVGIMLGHPYYRGVAKSVYSDLIGLVVRATGRTRKSRMASQRQSGLASVSDPAEHPALER